jgi:hypothetical protein
MIKKAFAEWMKENHNGKENAIRAKDMKHWGTAREIRHMVHDLRLEGCPICSGSTGYYYASNSSELSETLSWLDSMREDLEKAVDALKDTYYDLKHAELRSKS